MGYSPWNHKESDMTERLTHTFTDITHSQASLIAQLVKTLPAVQETQVRFLGWEDPLEKEMATHSSNLAWRIPWTEEHGRLQSMGSQRVGHDIFTFFHRMQHPDILLKRKVSGA